MLCQYHLSNSARILAKHSGSCSRTTPSNVVMEMDYRRAFSNERGLWYEIEPTYHFSKGLVWKMISIPQEKVLIHSIAQQIKFHAGCIYQRDIYLSFGCWARGLGISSFLGGWSFFWGCSFCFRPLKQSHGVLSTSLLPGL